MLGAPGPEAGPTLDRPPVGQTQPSQGGQDGFRGRGRGSWWRVGSL